MIKITNEIDGKKYELVPSYGCIGCDFYDKCGCRIDEELVYWDEKFPCLRLSGVWKEVKDED